LSLVIANKEKDKRADELIIIKKHQEQLEKIAHYDTLTNLPNRPLLANRLHHVMLQCSLAGASLIIMTCC
jgi:GGDEF domain-containing protein